MRKIPGFLFRALSFQNPDRAALRSAKRADWEAVLSDWQAARLALALQENYAEDLPDWVRSRIDAYSSDTALRFERIKAVYTRVAKALEDVNADHVVIKGFSLWPGYTRHPRFRPQGDIDLYCPPDSILKARDLLLAFGYTPNREQEHLPKDHLCTLMPQPGWKPTANLFDPDMPICFELHYCWWNESTMRLSPAGLDEFWQRRTARRVDDLLFPALDPIDNLAYTALNVLRDLFGALPAPEQVHGLARFLQTACDDEQFWRRWHDLHPDSLRQLEAISMRLAKEWFGCRLPEEVQEEIHAHPTIVHGWFHEFLKSGPSYGFALSKDGVWLHLTFLQSLRDKASVLRQGLFLVPKKMPRLADAVDETAQSAKSHFGPAVSRAVKYSWQLLRHAGWLASRSVVRLSKLSFFCWHGLRFRLSTTTLNRQFWVFLAAWLCFGLGMSIFFFLYNLYLLDRGFNERFLGAMTSAMNIGTIACAIPAGLIINRFGLRKSLLFCFLLVPSVSVARLFFLTRSALIFWAFLGGFVSTIWAIAVSPAVTRLTDEKSRPLAFSIVFSSGIGMGILANVIASRIPGWLVTLHPFMSITQAKQIALILGCTIVLLGLIPVSRLSFPSVNETGARLYPRNRFLLRFLPAVALWGLVTGSLSPLANVYFSHYLRMPLERIGTVFSFASLAQVLAVLAVPFFFRRIGLTSTLAATQAIVAVALCSLAAASAPIPASMIYVIYTGLLWMAEPGLYSLLMNRVQPAEQAGASAMNFLAISLAQAIAVAATGASLERFGYPPVLWAMAGVALLAAIYFGFVLRTPAAMGTDLTEGDYRSREAKVSSCVKADAARPS